MMVKKKKINILKVVTVSDIGGTETMLLNFLSAYDRSKFNVYVACLYSGGELQNKVEELDTAFFDLGLKRFWGLPFRLKRLIKKYEIDIVHVFGLTADVVIRPLAKLCGAKRFVSVVHSVGGPSSKMRIFFRRFAMSQADLWISNSYAGKEAAIHRDGIPADKITVIHNGMDFSQYIPQENEQHYEKNTQEFSVLTVANLRSMKGHKEIIKAVSILKQKGIDNIRFVFVGQDRSNGAIEALACEQNVRDYIDFCGFRKDLVSFYQKADLFLFPSEWEGLPGSVMEAMANGLAIVASDVGGIPELIEDGVSGILIKPKSPQSIADSIIDLMNNPEKRAFLGSNAKNKVFENFSLPKMVKSTTEIYTALCPKTEINPRPIKILRIIARLNIGGPAIQAIRLTSEFNSDEFQSKLVVGQVGKNEGDMSYLAEKWKVTPTIVSEMGREIHWWDDFIALYKLIKIIKDFNPDIVHTHTAKAGTLGRIAAFLCAVPVRVHTFHGHVFDGYFSPLVTNIFIFIERILARSSTRIISISTSQRKDLSEKYRIAPFNKFVVVPLGLDLNKFLEVKTDKFLRIKYGLEQGEIVVSIVGRLVPIKNHDLFIKVAAKIVKTKSIPVKFLVVGDGELFEPLQNRVKELGLENFITFTGWEKDVDEIYKISDIVALTSLNEGTPVSIIEAMAAGKPVISTDVGGVSDVIQNGENGFVVPSNDCDEFALKLTLLIEDDKLRKEFGEHGRNRVRDFYCTERLVKDIKLLYQSLLKDKGIL